MNEHASAPRAVLRSQGGLAMKVVVGSILEKLTEILFAGLSLTDIGDWLMNASVWMLLAIGIPKVLILWWLCVRYIPHNRVGVVEKLWSARGSLAEGRIIALNNEAGYQARLLRGGLHFGYYRWQYRIHKARLVTIPQGEIGYVYARDGEPLSPSQTLARIVASNNFQDAALFLEPGTEHPRGQRGRQRAMLREGVYAVNPALFVVITAGHVFAL